MPLIDFERGTKEDHLISRNNHVRGMAVPLINLTEAEGLPPMAEEVEAESEDMEVPPTSDSQKDTNFTAQESGSDESSSRTCSGTNPSVDDDIIPHGTGSLPNIAQGRRVSTPFSRRRIMSPKSLNLLCHVSRLHKAMGQKNGNSQTDRDSCDSSSYPAIKCDIVEYL